MNCWEIEKEAKEMKEYAMTSYNLSMQNDNNRTTARMQTLDELQEKYDLTYGEANAIVGEVETNYIGGGDNE